VTGTTGAVGGGRCRRIPQFIFFSRVAIAPSRTI
jgi:hypothetical protein